MRIRPLNDVLLPPAHSSPVTVLTTKITRELSLNIPMVSAAMDTVTESGLAIALAQEGGIGFIHKNMSPKQQAAEVAHPITGYPGMTVGE